MRRQNKLLEPVKGTCPPPRVGVGWELRRVSVSERQSGLRPGHEKCFLSLSESQWLTRTVTLPPRGRGNGLWVAGGAVTPPPCGARRVSGLPLRALRRVPGCAPRSAPTLRRQQKRLLFLEESKANGLGENGGERGLQGERAEQSPQAA